VVGKVEKGETAGLAKEALEQAREEARRLRLPTVGRNLRLEGGAPAFL